MGEYTQVSGTDQDLDFALEDKYSYQSTKTVDFELTDPQRLFVAEDLTSSEAFSVFSQYERVYGEALSLNEADVKQFSKPLTEQISSQDSKVRKMSKSLQAAVNLSDSLFKTVSKVEVELIVSNDLLDSTASFFRGYSEQVSLQDASPRSFGKSLSEGFTVSGFEEIKLVDKLSESLSVADSFEVISDYKTSLSVSLAMDAVYSREAELFRSLNESTALSSVLSPVVIVPLVESLSVNEVYGREIDYFRVFGGSVSANGELSNKSVKPLTESQVLSGAVTKSVVKDRAESIGLSTSTEIVGIIEFNELMLSSDLSSNRVFRDVAEDLNVLTESKYKASKFLSEAVVLNDSDVRRPVKSLTESVAGAGFTSEKSQFFRSQEESLTFNGLISLSRGRFLTEAFSVSDASSESVSKVLTEENVLDGFYEQELALQRTFDETAALNGETAKQVSTALNVESLALNDSDSFTLARSVPEQFSVSETVSRTVKPVLDETLQLQTDTVKAIELFRTEGVGSLAESDSSVYKVVGEDFAADDIYSREAELFRDYSERLDTAGSFDLSVSKLLVEDAVLSDAYSLKALYTLDESFAVEDVYGRELDYFRTLDKGVGFDDSYSRTVSSFRELSEEFSVAESFDSFRILRETLEETVLFDEEFDFFFSEGPGVPPYSVEIQAFDLYSVVNSFERKEYSVSIEFVEHPQKS